MTDVYMCTPYKHVNLRTHVHMCAHAQEQALRNIRKEPLGPLKALQATPYKHCTAAIPCEFWVGAEHQSLLIVLGLMCSRCCRMLPGNLLAAPKPNATHNMSEVLCYLDLKCFQIKTNICTSPSIIWILLGYYWEF